MSKEESAVWVPNPGPEGGYLRKEAADAAAAASKVLEGVKEEWKSEVGSFFGKFFPESNICGAFSIMYRIDGHHASASRKTLGSRFACV